MRKRITVIVLLLLIVFAGIATDPRDLVAGLISSNRQVSQPVFFVEPEIREPEVLDVQPQESEEEDDDEIIEVQLPPQPTLQDDIDEILEQIDLLQRQIDDLLALEEKPEEEIIEEDDEEIASEEKPEVAEETQPIYFNTGANPLYPELFISEIEIGGTNDAQNEFVELYNPNEEDVVLTDWYLQRKTKTGANYSSFAPKPLFEGKKIRARSYFLIAREGSSFALSADIVIDHPLTADNTLALKNPNGDIVDKVGWGAAQEYEFKPTQNPIAGQSISRKWVIDNEQDKGRNIDDFEAGMLTPQAQNRPYQAPETVLRDTVFPTAIFDMAAVQKELLFAINFTITDPVGAVSPSGINSYTFRWKEGDNEWQEDSLVQLENFPEVFSATKTITGTDEKIFSFQVKTTDIAGNESGWLPEPAATTKVSLYKKILINEIQGGSNESSEDDWVELYNPNNIDVDISEWSIQRAAQSGTILKKNFESGNTVKSLGYFLIVRNSASASLLAMADLVASAVQISKNSTIFLVSNKTSVENGQDADIVDKVGVDENAFSPETSPAPFPLDGKSISRNANHDDTDNNSLDFTSQNPDPQNSRFVEPPPPEEPIEPPLPPEEPIDPPAQEPPPQEPSAPESPPDEQPPLQDLPPALP